MEDRRNISNESDILRDLIHQMNLANPKIDDKFQEILEYGTPTTLTCLEWRVQRLQEILQMYYLEKRKKAQVKSNRQYLVQGYVNETR